MISGGAPLSLILIAILLVGNIVFAQTAPAEDSKFDFNLNLVSGSTTLDVMTGQSAVLELSVEASSAVAETVVLSAVGLPSEVGAIGLFPEDAIPPFNSTLMIDIDEFAPEGTYNIRIDATGGDLVRSVNLTLNVATLTLDYDFSISMNPEKVSITPGASTKYDISVENIQGVSPAVSLDVVGIPEDLAFVEFTPSAGVPPFTSTLEIRTDQEIDEGSFTVTVVGETESTSHDASSVMLIDAGAGGSFVKAQDIATIAILLGIPLSLYSFRIVKVKRKPVNA